MSFNDTAELNTANHAKKLRFITNQGAPHPKRRRVQAACLNCRRRKTACSGERPSCTTCIQNKLECSGYAKSAARHGSRPLLLARDLHATHVRTQSSPVQDNDIKPESSQSIPTIDSKTTNGTPNSPLLPTLRNRMPYFRWLGPTAIMPGFKQMVVKVTRRGTGPASATDDATAVSPGVNGLLLAPRSSSTAFSTSPLPTESNVRTPLPLPFYDTSSMPPGELITHLCEVFFTHLGCNFPFLQQDRFMNDLDAKQVDAILVDAVCAMAARFSTNTLLVEQADENGRTAPSEYGQAFAQRAKCSLVDTYAVPTVAAVQAALLIAYNEFGESRDRGLWVYLGIAIRMAQDLGLQKVEGLRYEGRDGPTPRMIKKAEKAIKPNPNDTKAPSKYEAESDEQEVRDFERERVDTFWAVFFLDKVVSVGTGRRSTLRDNDIELSFPPLDSSEAADGWPSPFPASIRIMHLYGRVSDLLNSINKPSDVNPDTSKRLAAMEANVTDFYQSLSPRLHFDPMNFHHYVKSGNGTTFVLVHIWFHTLIILLHRPTLLKTFEGKMLQLFPNSQQLSISSAKTIADILSYSQLVDTKAILGNPFTTQPIYIAACAFLKETADHTASSTNTSQAQSRVPSRAPTPKTGSPKLPLEKLPADSQLGPDRATDKTIAKHTLLVKRATQEFQLCYNALQSLEMYWAGTKYILTVIDQKVKGVGDPLLYTAEEGESSLEEPRPAPAFTSPGWRRKSGWTPSSMDRQDSLPRLGAKATSIKDPSQAIGWTMTGDLNSTNTNLSWHYPTVNTSGPIPVSESRKRPSQTLSQASLQDEPHHRSTSSSSFPPPTFVPQPQQPWPPAFPRIDPAYRYPNGMAWPTDTSPLQYESTPAYFPQDGTGPTSTAQFGDILIESQDVDMNMLGFDMLSWLGPGGEMGFLEDGGGGIGSA